MRLFSVYSSFWSVICGVMPPSRLYTRKCIIRVRVGEGLSEFNNSVSPTHARNTYFAYIGWLGGMLGVEWTLWSMEYYTAFIFVLYSLSPYTIFVKPPCTVGTDLCVCPDICRTLHSGIPLWVPTHARHRKLLLGNHKGLPIRWMCSDFSLCSKW